MGGPFDFIVSQCPNLWILRLDIWLIWFDKKHDDNKLGPGQGPGLIQGVPKKIGILSSFEFLGLGGVFLGVKNNSKNFGNKKNIGLYSKILSRWAFFSEKNAENFAISWVYGHVKNGKHF